MGLFNIQTSYDYMKDGWNVEVAIKEFWYYEAIPPDKSKFPLAEEEFALNIKTVVLPSIKFHWFVDSKSIMLGNGKQIIQLFMGNAEFRKRVDKIPDLKKSIYELFNDQPTNFLTSADIEYKLSKIATKQPAAQPVKSSMPEPQKPLVDACPAIEAMVTHPVHKHLRQPLGFIIMDLNDACNWTRDQIADWVETLDVDTTIGVLDE